MQKIVIDSDILIDHLRTSSDILDFILIQSSKKIVKPFIPSVVASEIYSGQGTKDEHNLKAAKELLGRFDFVSADENISELAGFLMRDHRPLKLGDAIIAATTLSLNAKLATRNIKDFANIKGLKFFKARI